MIRLPSVLPWGLTWAAGDKDLLTQESLLMWFLQPERSSKLLDNDPSAGSPTCAAVLAAAVKRYIFNQENNIIRKPIGQPQIHKLDI